MAVELLCLVVNALWGFGLVLLEIGGKTRVAGPAWNMGNRDAAPSFPPWVERAGRALGNHKENFPFFATGVIVAVLAQRTDSVTAAAAVVYVLARAAHGLVYVAGIPRVRSLVFLVGVGATLVIYAKLFV